MKEDTEPLQPRCLLVDIFLPKGAGRVFASQEYTGLAINASSFILPVCKYSALKYRLATELYHSFFIVQRRFTGDKIHLESSISQPLCFEGS